MAPPSTPVPAEPLASGELTAFVVAHEVGTLQGAADALDLTQSAVTKRIQSLERRLGARVFERSRSGVRPTTLGAALYPPAKLALAQLAEVARVASVGRERADSGLRISASHTIGEFLLPGWLLEFRRVEPLIHPQLEIINSAAAIGAVRNGSSEIAFVESRDPLRGLESMTVARDELCVVVTAGHRWGRRRSIAVGELQREPYLTRERNSGTRAVAAEALAAAHIVLEPALEAASTQSLKRALGATGFTIISRLAVAEEERSGTLVELTVRGADLTRHLRAARRRRGGSDRGARAFWRWLATRASPALSAAT
ncbi:MAG TPA: LysR family transcriptional regulator [Solirubrobacteraceae bacterium]|jgi:DNA-binding transcriptional LysR family regulator|nr:LysR family transcriptional regulator [Solirubrobacteraceae bacterium]